MKPKKSPGFLPLARSHLESFARPELSGCFVLSLPIQALPRAGSAATGLTSRAAVEFKAAPWQHIPTRAYHLPGRPQTLFSRHQGSWRANKQEDAIGHALHSHQSREGSQTPHVHPQKCSSCRVPGINCLIQSTALGDGCSTLTRGASGRRKETHIPSPPAPELTSHPQTPVSTERGSCTHSHPPRLCELPCAYSQPALTYTGVTC